MIYLFDSSTAKSDHKNERACNLLEQLLLDYPPTFPAVFKRLEYMTPLEVKAVVAHERACAEVDEQNRRMRDYFWANVDSILDEFDELDRQSQVSMELMRTKREMGLI